MEFTDVKEWLHWHADNLKLRGHMERLDNRICTIPAGDYVHLYEGIETVADIMGLGLVEDGKCEEYYRYYFLYENVKFMQLSEERLGKYAGND